jgi:hypothetical protein
MVMDEQARLIQVGDMSVMGAPSVKLLGALAAISEVLHPEFAKQDGGSYGEFSKDSCVLASLTVREFLYDIGYTRAEVRPVMTILRARRGGVELHSLGIGVTDQPDIERKGRWIGHMVAVIPEEGWLIDTTLFEAASRAAWKGAIGGMAAVALETEKLFTRNLPVLAQYAVRNGETTFQCLWMDNPTNKRWRGVGDANRRHWRTPVAKAMADAFYAKA